MKFYKNRVSNFYVACIVCILLFSFVGNLEQAQAPGRMGGGPHISTGERIGHIIDFGKTDFGKTDFGKTDFGKTDFGKTDFGKTDFGKTDFGKDFNPGPESKPETIELGSAKDFGYAPESTLIAKQLLEPKFGTSSKDLKLLNSIIAKEGLKLTQNKEAFVELIGPEHAQLHSNEPLLYLEHFISAHLLLYLNYVTKNQIFNIYSNFN